MGKWCLHASSFIFVRIIIKVAGNQGRHKSLVRFDFGPNQTTHFGVTCFEWRKFHTFEFEYLWNQLANLDQILCVASLGLGKGCIRFGADWPWHIGLRWAIVALWATCLAYLTILCSYCTIIFYMCRVCFCRPNASVIQDLLQFIFRPLS